MAKNNPSIIPQGASQEFLYVGEMIPNQVFVANLDTTNYASFRLASGAEGWSYFGSVAPGASVSILVEWPSGNATFTNNSLAAASINVYGLGIFPVES